MKNLIYFTAFCVLTVFSNCKKSDDNRAIIGSWELRHRSSGMTPSATFTKGNGNILKFTKFNYEIYTNGALTKSGEYVLIPDTTVQKNVCSVISSNQYKYRIVFDGKDDPLKTFIHVSNNELDIISGCFAIDTGYSANYQRQ